MDILTLGIHLLVYYGHSTSIEPSPRLRITLPPQRSSWVGRPGVKTQPAFVFLFTHHDSLTKTLELEHWKVFLMCVFLHLFNQTHRENLYKMVQRNNNNFDLAVSTIEIHLEVSTKQNCIKKYISTFYKMFVFAPLLFLSFQFHF